MRLMSLFRLVVIASFLANILFAQELIETGFLRDKSGQPITDVIKMRYKIYTQEVGGFPIWDSGRMTVTVNDGLYMVKLGSASQPTLDSHIFSTAQNYYMGFEVDGDVFPSRELISYHARSILADKAIQADVAVTANTALHVDWSNISGVPSFAKPVSNVKRGSGVFLSGQTNTTISDNFCTSDTLVYMSVKGPVVPLGVWNVDSADGIITVQSDRPESNPVYFEYVMINN